MSFSPPPPPPPFCEALLFMSRQYRSSRSRRSQSRHANCRVTESLEIRRLLVAPVTTSVIGRILYVSAESTEDQISLNASAGILTVEFVSFDSRSFSGEGHHSFLISALDAVVISAGGGDDHVSFDTSDASPSLLPITILGQDGDDTVSIRRGTALVDAGPGNDSVYAIDAQVTADYSNSPASVNVNLLNSLATEDGFGSTDVLAGVNHAIGSQYDDTLTGNHKSNTLHGGAGVGVGRVRVVSDRTRLCSIANMCD